jgi:RNA polymerase sigma-70 factor (ECF subfamily)
MWPDGNETQSLLEQARTGDAQAAERLLERHRAGLRRMVELRLSSGLQRRVDASDIVQEVLLAAHHRFDEYLRSAELPFHVWLRQIARDRMIDAYRRHAVAGRRSIRREQSLAAPAYADQSAVDLAMLLVDRETTPAANAVNRELQRRFADALTRLEETDREVVCMRHVEHLGNKEVASILGLSEPAAGMRYLRAMRRLRKLLAETPSERGTVE